MAKTAQPGSVNLHVNLLHPQGEPLQTPQKFFGWVLSYGRFIVIVVDIVVIGCFLFRFKLDADLQNINHQIQSEEDHLNSLSQQEALIKQVHQQVQIVKQTYETQPDWKTILPAIAAATPLNTHLTKLTADRTQNSKELSLKITAETTNNQEVATFLNNLRENSRQESDRDFKEVNVTNLSLSQGAILFTIAGKTNK